MGGEARNPLSLGKSHVKICPQLQTLGSWDATEARAAPSWCNSTRFRERLPAMCSSASKSELGRKQARICHHVCEQEIYPSDEQRCNRRRGIPRGCVCVCVFIANFPTYLLEMLLQVWNNVRSHTKQAGWMRSHCSARACR